MQFSLISATFTLTVLVTHKVVVWDALQGIAKLILLPKLIYFSLPFSWGDPQGHFMLLSAFFFLMQSKRATLVLNTAVCLLMCGVMLCKAEALEDPKLRQADHLYFQSTKLECMEELKCGRRPMLQLLLVCLIADPPKFHDFRRYLLSSLNGW